MATIVGDHYRYHETPHLDTAELFEYVKEYRKYPYLVQKKTRSQMSGNTELGSEIKKMEELSPIDWLAQKQNNAKIPAPDMNIIYSLSNNYGLSNGVINVVLDYVLKANNNMLSKNYCEKIAASLLREKIETAIDAMNYLEKLKISKTPRSSSRKEMYEPEERNIVNNEAPIQADDKGEISDEEMEALIASIRKPKKGGKK